MLRRVRAANSPWGGSPPIATGSLLSSPTRRFRAFGGDIYIAKEDPGQAMHGDRAVARVGRVESDGRAHGRFFVFLRRANPTVVGEFRIRRTRQLRGPPRGAHSAMDRNSGRNGDSCAKASADRVGGRAVKSIGCGSGWDDRERGDSRFWRGGTGRWGE